MNLILRIPDELAKRLTAAGASPERVALDALRKAADELGRRSQPLVEIVDDAEARRAAARAAAARIRQARAGTTLPAGMTIRDLVNYGRA
jgi:hypothetical protein